MRRALFVLFLLLILAGCTRGKPQESVDQRDYAGGAGIAIVLRDNASDPFHVNVTIRAPNTADLTIDRTIAPGASYEKWWSLQPASYAVRMVYAWNGTAGHAASGFDDRTADVASCANVLRLGWSYLVMNGTIASRFDGPECVPSSGPK